MVSQRLSQHMIVFNKQNPQDSSFIASSCVSLSRDKRQALYVQLFWRWVQPPNTSCAES